MDLVELSRLQFAITRYVPFLVCAAHFGFGVRFWSSWKLYM